MQAIILAGGLGTRIKKKFPNLPKPLIKLQNKSLIEHQINKLISSNITSILILCRYMPERIKSEINKINKEKNLYKDPIKVFVEDNNLGTAGAIYQAKHLLNENFLVLYGDTYLDVHLKRFVKFYNRDSNIDGLIFVHPNSHPYDSDVIIEGENNLIKDIRPYPHKTEEVLPNLVNAALYVLKKESFFKVYKDIDKSSIDICKNIFPEMIKKGLILKSYHSSEYIKDCGTPERHSQIENHLNLNIPGKRNLVNKQKAIFIDRDGTLILNEYIHSDQDDILISENSDKFLRKINSSEYLSILVSNQPAVAKGFIKEKDLSNISNNLDMELANRDCFLDKKYHCIHHQDIGFEKENINLKFSCNCRKPSTGNFLKASSEYNIEASNSWMIGDNVNDYLSSYLFGSTFIHLNKSLSLEDFIAPCISCQNFDEISHLIFNDYPMIVSKLEKNSNLINFTNNKDKRFILIGSNTRDLILKLKASIEILKKCTSRNFKKILFRKILYVPKKNIRKISIFERYLFRVINNNKIPEHIGFDLSPPSEYPLESNYEVRIVEGIVN